MEEQPKQQQQQQPPPSSSSSSSSSPSQPPHHHHHHHHHHHYYYYNHNHHQHHQQYLGEGGGGGGGGKTPATAKAPLQGLKYEAKHGGAATAAAGPLQEGPRKKTGYCELNGNAGERECSRDTPGPMSRVANGSQPPGDSTFPLKPSMKGGPFGKPGLKPKSYIPKGGMDKKGERCYESKTREAQLSDKSEVISIPNGVVTNSSGYITNGYVGKGADNDGSGSESGYMTPKKRKGRRNSAKGCENLNLVPEKMVQHDPPIPPALALKQEPEGFKPDCGEPKAGNRVEGLKPAWKCEPGGLGLGRGKPGIGDVPRKNSEAKVGIVAKKFEERPKGKHVSAASSKEDSWTLFKPPPVFPVDNSSAKIVPKISYASKVKENLNKAAQNPASSLSSSSSSSSSSSLCLSSSADGQVQTSNRLSQVPMSAMKSVTSVNFSNGPVLAGADRGMTCPAGTQSLLMPASSAIFVAPLELVPQEPSLASEQPKSSLLIYPSNMQALLDAAVRAEPPFPGQQQQQQQQQNLGDIFQNQWGLSFINEPSAGPETGARKPADIKATEVTFQGESPPTLVSRGAESVPTGPNPPPAFPKAYELDKRTCPQLLSGILKLGTPGEGGGGGGFFLDSHPSSGPGAFVFLAKDYHVENRLASPTNNLLASSAKEQRYPRGLERKESWGDFDLRAAVLYHTQEMESICNLQKQDPKRIITYDEAMDRLNQ